MTDLVKRPFDLIPRLITIYGHAYVPASALESLTAENAALKSECAEEKAEADTYCRWWREQRDLAATLLQQRNEAFERAAAKVEAMYGEDEKVHPVQIAAGIRNLSKES